MRAPDPAKGKELELLSTESQLDTLLLGFEMVKWSYHARGNHIFIELFKPTKFSPLHPTPCKPDYHNKVKTQVRIFVITKEESQSGSLKTKAT